MGIPKTVRFDDELEKKIERYLESNGIKFARPTVQVCGGAPGDPDTVAGAAAARQAAAAREAAAAEGAAG